MPLNPEGKRHESKQPTEEPEKNGAQHAINAEVEGWKQTKKRGFPRSGQA